MNLEQAARFVLRTVESDDTLGEYDHAIACLRAAVLQLDLYAVTAERDMLQEQNERLQQALERTVYDRDRLSIENVQLRESARLSKAAQRDAQNGYASERLAATIGYTHERGVRTATAWQCARCKQYTAPSDSMPSVCEQCEELIASDYGSQSDEFPLNCF